MVHDKNFPFHSKDVEDDFVHVSRAGLSGFGKFVVTTIFIGIVGGAGYFGYNHFKKQPQIVASEYSANGLPLIKADTTPYKSEPLNPNTLSQSPAPDATNDAVWYPVGEGVG